MKDRKLLEQMAKRFADDGKLIEIGWLLLRQNVLDANCPPIQIQEMRLAFMAGAQHLFACIISILDPNENTETADVDVNCIILIAKELEAFKQELETRFAKPAGNA